MGTLYDRYGKLAFTLILRIVHDRSLAENILAEALVKAWNQIGRWKDTRAEGFGLWILLLSRNHAIQSLQENGGLRGSPLPRFTALEQPALLPEPPRARNSGQWRLLRNSLAALNPNERRILELTCFEGLQPTEIAPKLDLPVAAVTSCINAALEKLETRVTKNVKLSSPRESAS